MSGAGDKELWQQCVDWIKSTGVLPREASFVKLADFAASIRNGVLLCELAMKLSPDCIDRHEIMAQYQHSPFICSKNIALFLAACHNSFGIEELFGEDDLLELSNFPAVLRLLSQLSRNQKSRQLLLKPFPEETVLPKELPFADESIYCNLREEVDQQYKHLGQYAVLNKQGQQDQERTGQEIYDSICSQKVPRNKSLPISYSDFKPANKREHCLKELLDTEVNYCEALQMVVDTFFARMRFHLRSEDLATVFINIEDILRLNRQFLTKLSQAILRILGLQEQQRLGAKEPPMQIADVFLHFKMHFTIYGIYCSRLNASANRIEELERGDPNIKQIIAELGKDIQFKLQALLIVPFQRITRYHLLLESLIKNTPDVVDQTTLNNAYEAMKDVVTYVNEMKRDQETIEFINTIQRSIPSLDVNLLDYGRILCDDCLKISVTQNGESSSRQRYVFLFEKMILSAKRESGMYKAKHIFLLSDFELVENELELAHHQHPHKYNTISRKLTNSFFDTNIFTIVKRENGNGGATTGNNGGQTAQQPQATTSIQLAFKTATDKNNWKQLVRKAIDINNPKAAVAKGHSLYYKSYKMATVCSVCQMLLSGKFFQGYHCSVCNKDMHGECAQMKECVWNSNRKSDPFNGMLNGNGSSSGNRRATLQPQSYHPGEVVSSRQTIPPNGNLSRLSCQNGDFIELLKVHAQQEGRLSLHLQPQQHNNNQTCLMPLDTPAGKTSNLLEQHVKRRSGGGRLSRDSLSEVIPLQAGSSPPVGPSNLNLTPPPAASNLHADYRPMFVSSHIIHLSEHLYDVTQQPWYFEEIGRDRVKTLLDGTETGTFVVRWSVEKQQFVLSLRYDNAAKHIKIEFDTERKKFYLHSERFFDSVVQLVNFYRSNNLSEGFTVDTVLKGTPLKGNLFRAVSAYNRPDSSKYLSLNPGDIVRVLDTAGDGNGWWKGSVGDARVGFFPVSFVERIPAESDPQELEQQQQQFPAPAQTVPGEQQTNGGCGVVAYQSTANGQEIVQMTVQEGQHHQHGSPQNGGQQEEQQSSCGLTFDGSKTQRHKMPNVPIRG